MSDQANKQFAVGVAALSTVALTFILGVRSQRNKIQNTKSGICRRFEITEATEWLDQGSYDVITSIVDTFLPSIVPHELTLGRLHEAVDAIHPKLRKFGVPIDQSVLEEHRDYLCRGALDMNLHTIVAEALGKLITDTERLQAHLMLRVLSTSLGCYMVTGFPAAFQVICKIS